MAQLFNSLLSGFGCSFHPAIFVGLRIGPDLSSCLAVVGGTNVDSVESATGQSMAALAPCE